MYSARQLTARMAADIGMLPSDLQKVIRTAPLRYKTFQIPKRTGGMRDVAQPAREVKALQRWLVNELTLYLPVHLSATAYRDGGSIKTNAQRHVRNRFILKLDFRAFFPSILYEDILQHLAQHCSSLLEPSAIRLVGYVCCWAPNRTPPLRLCIGAPSSPLLSNTVLFELDTLLAAKAIADGVTYTRYADDLTFSTNTPQILRNYPQHVRAIAESLAYPRLTLNEQKTVFASRRGRRSVTGIVLTPDATLSIGRERKRLVRAMYHRRLLKGLTVKEEEILTGLLAFAEHIEPGFKARLLRTEDK